MKILKLFQITIMLLLVMSCNKSNSYNSPIEKFVFDAAKSKPYFDFATITDTSYQIIPLETSPDFLIGRVEKIEIKDNKIIIFDRMSRSIYLFNMDGSAYSKISRLGRGPGEYMEISAMGASDSTIVIFDMALRKFLEFDFDGHLITEALLQSDIWANDIFFFNDKLYLYTDWDECEWGNSRLYLLDDISNQNFEFFLSFDEEPLTLGNMGPSYSICKDKASLIYSGCDTVFSITKEGIVSPSYVFDFKGKRAKYPSRRPELVYEENEDDRIVNIDWVSESERYFFTSIETVGFDHGFVYDKDEKTHQIFDIAVNSNLSQFFMFSHRWVIDNKIVMPQSMSNVHRAGTFSESEYKLEGFYNQLKGVIENGNIEDNPVVFIFNLKN
ncbi:6-bladed beta-propeller [Natronoflexus pectinivorans]|uniref:6-bladed beta-propeller protein n=1 Tax=Natronoflexus pectinivorans TaxID=682526 RepID=A0A4R2GIU3_9BACT|nr:6-bladed beta-propeller [Natronoflexus pectinivorans]TCO08222.1 6-bladed beta-propeller protein [Natronoflexus pectinivorans]